jgi:hypothetical protein
LFAATRHSPPSAPGPHDLPGKHRVDRGLVGARW